MQTNSFQLQYLINFRAHHVEAIMLRHTDSDVGDWFSVHRASDSVELGRAYQCASESDDEVKAAALHDASYNYPRKFDLLTV